MNTPELEPHVLVRLKTAIGMMKGGLFLERPVNDPWDMAGDRHRAARGNVMAALCGKRQPLNKCGVSFINQKLREVLNIPQNVQTGDVVKEFRTKYNV